MMAFGPSFTSLLTVEVFKMSKPAVPLIWFASPALLVPLAPLPEWLLRSLTIFWDLTSIDWLIDVWIDQSLDRWIDQSIYAWMDGLANVWLGLSINQSIDRSFEESIKQSIHRFFDCTIDLSAGLAPAPPGIGFLRLCCGVFFLFFLGFGVVGMTTLYITI